MSGGAHKLMGVVLGGMIISVVEPTFPVAGLILGMSVLGELAPDIDTVNSTISLRIPIIPKIINRKFGHRGLLHSPLFLVLSWLVIGRQNLIGNVFCIGYLGHLVQDLFTLTLPLSNGIYFYSMIFDTQKYATGKIQIINPNTPSSINDQTDR